jgi:translation initiation factor 2 alpha subunit (eIF-2alpha)
MDNFFQIYHKDKPDTGELVLIKFTNRLDTHFEGELIEYNLNAFMSYNDATKKKKIYSWNKVIKLNKPMVAKVEEVFEDGQVQVSVAYNDKDIEMREYLRPFNENKTLISIIRKLCHVHNIDFYDFWTNVIYEIDKIRDVSLFEYTKENISSNIEISKSPRSINFL